MYIFPHEFTALFYLITPYISAIILRSSLKGCKQASMGEWRKLIADRRKGRHNK